MNIRNRRALKIEASASLSGSRNHKKIVAVYMGVSTLLAVLVTVLDLVLGNMMDNTGGLSNLGNRAILETAQAALPIFQSAILLFWEMGYLRAMQDVSQGRRTDERTLTWGFSHFGPILRLTLLMLLYFGSLLMVSIYTGTMIFVLTPYAEPVVNAVNAAPSASMLSGEVMITDELLMAVDGAMGPMMLICMGVFALLALPIYYRFRFAQLCLLDNPGMGALAALRKSAGMTRKNRMQLFKLDLSFWWLYLLEILAGVVMYADLLLAMVGIQLPIPALAAELASYGLYLLVNFGISYAFLNYRTVTWAKAYEALLPPEQPASGGVVLGNIFQM